MKNIIRERLKMIHHFYSFYNDEHGFLNVLKNMLLVQSFCKANNIPYQLVWTEHDQINDPTMTSSPVLAPLLKALDRQLICPFGITDSDICVDKAADQAHPGPQSQKLYADRLSEFTQLHVFNK